MNYLTARNNVILSLLLNKDAKGIDEEKYAEVIALLGLEQNIDDMCAFIYQSKKKELCLEKRLTDEKVLKTLTTPYCIEKAYEFVIYLNYIHHDENKSRAR